VSYRDGDGEDVYDLRSSSGQKDYCRNIKPKKITKTALEGGKFSHCLNGMRHNSIQARGLSGVETEPTRYTAMFGV